MNGGCNGYPPPSDCPTPTQTTSTPSPTSPPGTAFTGGDLAIPSIVMVLFLLGAVLFGVLSRAFSKDRP